MGWAYKKSVGWGIADTVFEQIKPLFRSLQITEMQVHASTASNKTEQDNLTQTCLPLTFPTTLREYICHFLSNPWGTPILHQYYGLSEIAYFTSSETHSSLVKHPEFSQKFKTPRKSQASRYP